MMVSNNMENMSVSENNLTEFPGPRYGVCNSIYVNDPDGVLLSNNIIGIQPKEDSAMKDSGKSKEENLIEQVVYDEAIPLSDAHYNDVYIGIEYTEEELMLVSKLVTAEAGCVWLSDEHQCLVASVVKNRVLDERFPNTIYGVISQPGQYSPYIGGYLYCQQPDQRTIENCRKVLDGEFACDLSVVWQSGCVQGEGVYKAIYDETLNTTTYFCY